MSLITNHANNPGNTLTINKAGRVDYAGWNVTDVAANAPGVVVSADCRLVSGSGTIRFGWDDDHTLGKSGRLTATPQSGIYPQITIITTGDAVWKVSDIIVTSTDEYARLQSLGLTFFNGDTMPQQN